ncbi:hypothetical protein AYI68_g8219 [Smittium mucronatum]|uniref:Uncharacterized protein n=1 Tax=Smittium mucronatum TaxID=133383 RepID=A0A1R0GLI4_9FUNG|nr:hypothetical protein AYI68_g8219 [Smittium mucronatum]
METSTNFDESSAEPSLAQEHSLDSATTKTRLSADLLMFDPSNTGNQPESEIKEPLAEQSEYTKDQIKQIVADSDIALPSLQVLKSAMISLNRLIDEAQLEQKSLESSSMAFNQAIQGLIDQAERIKLENKTSSGSGPSPTSKQTSRFGFLTKRGNS